MTSPTSGQCSHFITPKTQENQRFSGVFKGYKVGSMARNRVKSKLNGMFRIELTRLHNSSFLLIVLSKSDVWKDSHPYLRTAVCNNF